MGLCLAATWALDLVMLVVVVAATCVGAGVVYATAPLSVGSGRTGPRPEAPGNQRSGLQYGTYRRCRIVGFFSKKSRAVDPHSFFADPDQAVFLELS